MGGVTTANLRHAIGMLRFGWLNLGLWEGDGSDPSEAVAAVRRLVTRMAHDLPTGGDVLDVGNGLAAQDPVIADVSSARSLTALNITRSQLVAGRERLAAAGASAVNGDASRMPFAPGSFDGVISVEAAFHFPSRASFFAEAFRVLRPGGVLTISDVPVLRFPATPREVLAGIAMLRLWGIRARAAATPLEIEHQVSAAGFDDVRSVLEGARVIAPAFRSVHARLDDESAGGLPERLAARTMLREAEVLWEHGVLEYLFLVARKS
jgi:SAM-dependent methyltransferase